MIVAVVVAYFPRSEQLEHLICNLSEQVAGIVVVDNTPKANAAPDWFSSSNDPHARWLALGRNVGIARAHNLGIEAAKSMQAEQVILFDQDSQVNTGFVEGLAVAANSLRSQGIQLACIGPRPFCLHENKESKPRVQSPLGKFGEVTLVRQIIASGMLIRLSDFDQVGPKESGLFIDGVDHEWCWRALAKGFSVAVCETVKMPHVLGDSRGGLLGLSYKVGSPERLYYQFRNILVLSRRPYVPLYWKVRNLLAMPIRFLLMSLFQAPRYKRCRLMLKGVWHGLAAKSGPLDK
ncbi:glycosyltransferase family 2 protein [Neiella marina]|uniref:Glycosyltransferase family 2 protein n=1 Tax=Neiella holothuriorum TaxID=2870530 RepID=A0ABS7EG09_9GAMM|nr:glycosyltransferase family 2 protein [Neiella holothuriorum]MBW8190736.1 glycosyltransferase family 2 protein [Neiella holothuriorum]